MGRSSFSQSCTDAIRNYQPSDARDRTRACRFDPTCSEYALEALETRAWPIAFMMTASRLARCSPLAHASRATRCSDRGVVFSGPVLWTEHVRRHGHWTLGFFSGLLFGLGATVLLWQYNVWLLNVVTAIVVPVVVGILFALVAWRGTRYTITATAPATGVDTTPPAPAPAVDVVDDAQEPPAPEPAA